MDHSETSLSLSLPISLQRRPHERNRELNCLNDVPSYLSLARRKLGPSTISSTESHLSLEEILTRPFGDAFCPRLAMRTAPCAMLFSRSATSTRTVHHTLGTSLKRWTSHKSFQLDGIIAAWRTSAPKWHTYKVMMIIY